MICNLKYSNNNLILYSILLKYSILFILFKNQSNNMKYSDGSPPPQPVNHERR